MMAVCSQKQKGFTIVELLIVVIVVAILAAVSVVAYTNIQNRASDSAVQADIRNFVGKVKEFQAMNGRYPRGAASAPSTAQLAVQGIPQFSLAHGAYSLSHHNFYYCATDEQFAVGAVSKSGTIFYYTIESGLVEYTGGWGGSSSNCPGMLGFSDGWTSSYAYNHSTGAWAVWAQ